MKLNWRTLLHIHIYLGLFCLPYLVVFSLSSLNFNHHFLATKPLYEGKEWDAKLKLQIGDDLEAMSGELKDSLGIFGWYIPWDSYRDSLGAKIVISQPGKKYVVRINKEGDIKVVEKPESLENVIKLLHFIGEDIPHAPWQVNMWQYYQDMTVYSMLFWVITGIILWMRKKKRPRVESILLWGMGLISILFIMWIWLIA